MKQSDAYFEYDREAWLRSNMEERKAGAESAGATYMVSTDTYFCKVFALHDDIPDQMRANADMPLAPDQDSTEFLTEQATAAKGNLLCQRLPERQRVDAIGRWCRLALGHA